MWEGWIYILIQLVEGSSQDFANLPELPAHCTGKAEQPAVVLERCRSADPGIQQSRAPRKGRREVPDGISTVAMCAYHFDTKIKMKWQNVFLDFLMYPHKGVSVYQTSRMHQKLC